MVTINLLCWSEQNKAAQIKAISRYLILVAAIIGLILVGWCSVLQHELAQVTFKVKQSSQIAGNLEGKYFAIIRQQREAQQLQANYLLVKQLTNAADNGIKLLSELSKNIPNAARLVVLQLKDSAVTLMGEATSVAAISEFLRRLTKSNLFTKITLEEITSNANGNNYLIDMVRGVT